MSALESLPFLAALRAHGALYLAIGTLHIAGFVALVGGIFVLDLRLLGFSRSIPVRALVRHVMPWCAAALLVVVPTGLALFAANAADLINQRPFQLKMALLLAAGLNAAIFHTGAYQGVERWNADAAPPAGARLAAAFSLANWAAIIACGRLLAPV